MSFTGELFNQHYTQQQFHEAMFFRELALSIDAAPQSIIAHDQHQVMQYLSRHRDSTALEKVGFVEALSYGDPGVFLASPWHSLAGIIMNILGTAEQINYFYEYIANNQVRSFFALTEPNKGSDAGNLQCLLVRDQTKPGSYYLRGDKYLIGNGEIAQLGVVVARLSASPLSICVVFISPDKLQNQHAQLNRELLPSCGLRGLQLAKLSFKNFQVDENDILGAHLLPLERGMASVIKTLNHLRPSVGAMALGQAQAVLDYCYAFQQLPDSAYYKMCLEVTMARKHVQEAARKIDIDPLEGTWASWAKYSAVNTTVTVINQCIAKLKQNVFLENQWLAKCYRDCYCWEYMEGTRHMLLKNVFQQFKQHNLREKIKC